VRYLLVSCSPEHLFKRLQGVVAAYWVLLHVTNVVVRGLGMGEGGEGQYKSINCCSSLNMIIPIPFPLLEEVLYGKLFIW